MARDVTSLGPARKAVLLAVACLIGALATPLPHVDDCFLCRKCHTGQPPGRRLLAAGSLLADPAADSSLAAAWRAAALETDSHAASAGHGRALQARKRKRKAMKEQEAMYVPPGFKFQNMPLKEEIEAKVAKPNCTECYGCSTQIEPLQAVATVAMGANMRTEVGASPEWLFFADLPDTATTGKRAVLKVWCVPIDKVRGTFTWRCVNTGEGAVAVQFLLAQQKVMEECGLMDVTVKVWAGRVNAVVPSHGVHVWWDGLWMERAEGVSLNQMSYKRARSFSGTMLSVLGERLNKTRVQRAAIYDLLSSQCDRHAQNVFLNEDGNIKLIDNLQALQFSWMNCALDSIFLPGTQKNMIARYGGTLIFKSPKAKPRRSVNPMVLLDYRCYTPGGKIGTNYDPQLSQCLTKLSKMSAKEVQTEYGFPYLHSAAVLQQRASDMINKGFEWTVRYGHPRSAKPKTYRPGQPCCGLNITRKLVIQCAHEWQAQPELPFGDPMRGTAWERAYPDAGTYEGGTFLDEPAE